MPMTPKFIKDGPFPMAAEVGAWNSLKAPASDGALTEVMPLQDGSGWIVRTTSAHGVALCFIPNAATQPSR